MTKSFKPLEKFSGYKLSIRATKSGIESRMLRTVTSQLRQGFLLEPIAPHLRN